MVNQKARARGPISTHRTICCRHSAHHPDKRCIRQSPLSGSGAAARLGTINGSFGPKRPTRNEKNRGFLEVENTLKPLFEHVDTHLPRVKKCLENVVWGYDWGIWDMNIGNINFKQ